MKQCFVRYLMGSLDDVMKWLNGLVGSKPDTWKDDTIVRVIDWQVVGTGRPYEYNAIARVEVEPRERK